MQQFDFSPSQFCPFLALELIYHAVRQPIYMENTFNVQLQNASPANSVVY